MANILQNFGLYPNGSTRRITLYTGATGQTVAVTISKNGAAFGNPSAGATNATEIADGFYYFTPSATDTGTDGPLIVKGNGGGDISYSQWEVTNSLPTAQAGAANGLMIRDSTTQDAIATAFLDLAAGVETSVTVRQAFRAIASVLAGNVTGTSGDAYKAIANSGTTRVTFTNPTTTTRSATLNL